MHVFPQKPQLFGSDPSVVHLPKQATWPGAHVMGVQTPALQKRPVGQVAPHAPQLVTLVARSTHWPLHWAGRWPRHPHLPETHWSPFGHALPQVLQLRGSVERLTQAPLQLVVCGPHAAEHEPCAQTLPAGHARPHLPQSAGFDVGSTQSPLHRMVLPGHAHWPASHATPVGQALPHAPQLDWFDVRSTHPPLHAVSPVKQPLEQSPWLQTLPAGQALLQFPQLAGSEVRSTHTPEHVVPVAHTAPPSHTGNGSRSSEARPHPVPAKPVKTDTKNKAERNRRKLDMARAPSETPHDAPVEVQSFAGSLHRVRTSAKGFAPRLGAGAITAVFAGAVATSCGSVSNSAPTAYSVSAIEDGTTDDAHTFAVGVVQLTQELAFCSGVLLAPNLVATARHCVAQTPSQRIDCATSAFGPVLPLADLMVTTATVLTDRDNYAHVVQIIVPSGASQTKVCGNDIALMILDRNIALPQYVEPTIMPPMTAYSTNVTVIGYGLSTPLDEAGVTAGTRRIKENIPLYCIPNDTSFVDCFSNPMASQVLSTDEFVSGDDSTCEGDSGSGAFDQTSFNRGQWVSFGVLSRGAVSTDGKTCLQPVYSRFDAWGSLLVGAATQAAAMGGYSAPVWAGGTGPDLTPAADAAAAGDAAGPIATSKPTPGSLADGTTCGADSDCAAQNCVSTDDVTFVCASPCSAGRCTAGFACTSGYCFESASTTPRTSGDGSASPPLATHAKGCSMTPFQSDARASGAGSGLAVLALFGAVTSRRRLRRRRAAKPPSRQG